MLQFPDPVGFEKRALSFRHLLLIQKRRAKFVPGAREQLRFVDAVGLDDSIAEQTPSLRRTLPCLPFMLANRIKSLALRPFIWPSRRLPRDRVAASAAASRTHLIGNRPNSG